MLMAASLPGLGKMTILTVAVTTSSGGGGVGPALKPLFPPKTHLCHQEQKVRVVLRIFERLASVLTLPLKHSPSLYFSF